MKKSIAILLTAALGASLLTGCVTKATDDGHHRCRRHHGRDRDRHGGGHRG